jgi:hypothetical protein
MHFSSRPVIVLPVIFHIWGALSKPAGKTRVEVLYLGVEGLWDKTKNFMDDVL